MNTYTVIVFASNQWPEVRQHLDEEEVRDWVSRLMQEGYGGVYKIEIVRETKDTD